MKLEGIVVIARREPKADAIGSIGYLREKNPHGHNARFGRNARFVILEKQELKPVSFRTEGNEV